MVSYILDIEKQYTLNKDDYYHSYDDNAAVIYINGLKIWYKNGLVHRDLGPAVIFPFNLVAYYRNGVLRNDYGKPVRVLNELIDRKIYLCTLDENDRYHSYNNLPAFIQKDNKCCKWYKHGRIHRENDEPAIIYSTGVKMWYKDGKLHRYNNPAVVWPSGKRAWYYNGEFISDRN